MEYILYDVDKIKDYVFDSYKPKEVKGASELLKVLDYDPKTKKKEALLQQLTEEFPEITDDAIIFSKGGTGLLKSAADKGMEICHFLESQFPQMAPGASLTAVYHKEEPRFSTTRDILNFLAREKKSGKAVSRSLLITEFGENEKNRCDACGKRTAFKSERIHNEEFPYCDVCRRKRHALDKQPKEKIEADSLEDICKVPGLPDSKFILTIYGDLNQAGNHLANIEDEAGLIQFSRGIFDTLEETRREIESQLGQKGFKVLAPVIGGDDIIIFVHPASFPLIFEKLTRIEDTLSHRLGKNLEMNFAFLLSKYTLPIYHIFQLSQSLLEETKDAYYENKSKTGQYGFFKVLEGGHRPSCQDVYPLAQFKTLFELATRFHRDAKIHKSALYNLLNAISANRSPEEKEINVLYFLAQHREFKSYVKYAPPNFYFSLEGKDIELTAAALEDMITMQEWAETFSLPSVAKFIPGQTQEAQ